MIKACQIDLNSQHILYDANQQPNIGVNWFDPEYWQRNGCVTGYAKGRASTIFFTYQDADYVLRHYHRGGLIAKFARDSYCWTGLDSTRAWREWHLLAELHESGLPVPTPVAARVKRHGFYYRADLIIRRVADTVSLTQQLSVQGLSDELWQELGATVALFHNAGVYHADLNAHNILVQNKTFYLIDFDRGRIRKQEERWQQSNINRLLRSLNKVKMMTKNFKFQPDHWHAFMLGYAQRLNNKG